MLGGLAEGLLEDGADVIAAGVHEVGRQAEATELRFHRFADRRVAGGDGAEADQERQERADVRAALHVDARDEIEQPLRRQVVEHRRQQLALARVVVGDDAQQLVTDFVGQAIDEVGEPLLHDGPFGGRQPSQAGAGDEQTLGRGADAGAFRQRQLALDGRGDGLRIEDPSAAAGAAWSAGRAVAGCARRAGPARAEHGGAERAARAEGVAESGQPGDVAAVAAPVSRRTRRRPASAAMRCHAPRPPSPDSTSPGASSKAAPV